MAIPGEFIALVVQLYLLYLALDFGVTPSASMTGIELESQASDGAKGNGLFECESQQVTHAPVQLQIWVCVVLSKGLPG
jgi:hypothetical protein